MEENNSKVYELGIETELRIVVDEETKDVTLELSSGYAEIFGSEVILGKVYKLPPSSSFSLFTWKGCVVKLTGEHETEISKDSLIMLVVDIHACLEERRILASQQKANGPICLVVGPTDVGKTSFCYMLLNYAARLGRRPVFVDLDVGQSSISVPGTVSMLSVERQSDIIEGFSEKNAAVYPFGHKSPGHNMALYYLLIKKLGQMLQTRLVNADENMKSSGVIIDTCGWVRSLGYRAITLVACSFEINVLFVVEEEKLFLQLRKDMPSSVEVVYVPQQHGVYERSRTVRVNKRERRVWEYFYGVTGNLRPFKIKVKISDAKIYSIKSKHCTANTLFSTENTPDIDAETVSSADLNIVSVPFTPELECCILALSYADNIDENFMVTNAIGFVFVTEVNVLEDVMTVLSPQPEPLPSNIFILGDIKTKYTNVLTDNYSV